MATDAITNLITLAIETGAYDQLDAVYVRNRVYALIGDQATVAQEGDGADAISRALVNAAIANGKIEDNPTDRELLASQLMDLVTPRPSQVNQHFWDQFQQGAQHATDYFYQLTKLNDDVKTAAIAKNVVFDAPTNFGDLEITINLSKPEKDPKAIAAAAKQQAAGYPLCQLCLENEGYLGRLGYPARSNHRVVRMTVGGQAWGFQYSPYAYFNEHSIFFSEQHVPMKINRQTFVNLLEIETQLPHYFVGSNADLPIIGGSMLSHEHYQGGRHVFPMMKAPVLDEISLPDFPAVKVNVVKWPMTTFRLVSSDVQALASAAEYIRQVWADYDDESVDVRSHAADGTPHHTITPIAYRNGEQYVLDVVLRDNQTSTAYPDGIFHPHPELHHIKKENIGLIEVMGRAILPARLKGELQDVEAYLLDGSAPVAEYHKDWADELRAQQSVTAENAHSVVEQAVGEVFSQVLADAGVFKWDTDGRAALQRFIGALG